FVLEVWPPFVLVLASSSLLSSLYLKRRQIEARRNPPPSPPHSNLHGSRRGPGVLFPLFGGGWSPERRRAGVHPPIRRPAPSPSPSPR
uniref:Uncharacterized protein n=1 Tax=Aegilops tauschii subsp. strangulata TaxID=200361 RepID=A0A453RPM0_AEGTS